MSKILNTIISAGITVATVAFAKRWLADTGDWFADIELDHVVLTQPDLRPGPWYCYYLGDYLTAHPGETVVYSSPLELRDGTFIWATNSPEWDRLWFEGRGFEFPAQWVPYNDLAGLPIEMTTMGS